MGGARLRSAAADPGGGLVRAVGAAERFEERATLRMGKLMCPRCGARYPRRRLLFSGSTLTCVSCHAQLTMSRDSAGRLGFVGGLTLFVCAAVSGWIWGFDTLWSWQSLLGFMAFGFVLGLAIKPIVAVLVLRSSPCRPTGRVVRYRPIHDVSVD